jgi:hypothetical protein
MELTNYLADGVGLTSRAWFGIGVATLATCFICSEFAPWKSPTLSPESIKRRFFWFGVLAFVSCLFVSLLPDWEDGLFATCATLLCFGRRTADQIARRHSAVIKIDGSAVSTEFAIVSKP